MRWILPWIMTQMLRAPRYVPEFEWSETSWTHNAFRFYELIFGRRYGIRAEMSSRAKNGKVIYACHSWESAFALTETFIREWLAWRPIIPVRIWIPILYTPQGMPVFSSPYIFAIATDAADTAFHNTASATSGTYSFTCTGSNLILLIGFETGTNAQGQESPTITYNSVSMTGDFAVAAADNTYRWITLFRLLGPATGANTVSWTTAAGVPGELSSASYSGVSQSGYPDSSNTGTQTGIANLATWTATTTVVASNCWMIVCRGGPGGGHPIQGTGSLRAPSAQTNGVGDAALYDSNATVPTGSQSMTFQNNTGGTSLVSWIAISLAPVAAATTTVIVSTLAFLGAG